VRAGPRIPRLEITKTAREQLESISAHLLLSPDLYTSKDDASHTADAKADYGEDAGRVGKVVSVHLDESIREFIKLIVCETDRGTFKGLHAALDRL
jgi:hypothetical protein